MLPGTADLPSLRGAREISLEAPFAKSERHCGVEHARAKDKMAAIEGFGERVHVLDRQRQTLRIHVSPFPPEGGRPPPNRILPGPDGVYRTLFGPGLRTLGGLSAFEDGLDKPDPATLGGTPTLAGD